MYKYIIGMILSVALFNISTMAQAGGGEILWQWPVHQPLVVSAFNQRGVQLYGQLNEVVYPVFAGTVVKANCNDRANYGCYVVIQHQRYDAGSKGVYYYDHYRTVYAQLQDISVRVGQVVNVNTKLGTIGINEHNKYKPTEPQLRFEIRTVDQSGKYKKIIKGWKYFDYLK